MRLNLTKAYLILSLSYAINPHNEPYPGMCCTSFDSKLRIIYINFRAGRRGRWYEELIYDLSYVAKHVRLSWQDVLTLHGSNRLTWGLYGDEVWDSRIFFGFLSPQNLALAKKKMRQNCARIKKKFSASHIMSKSIIGEKTALPRSTYTEKKVLLYQQNHLLK